MCFPGHSGFAACPLHYLITPKGSIPVQTKLQIKDRGKGSFSISFSYTELVISHVQDGREAEAWSMPMLWNRLTNSSCVMLKNANGVVVLQTLSGFKRNQDDFANDSWSEISEFLSRTALSSDLAFCGSQAVGWCLLSGQQQKHTHMVWCLVSVVFWYLFVCVTQAACLALTGSSGNQGAPGWCKSQAAFEIK